MPLIRENSFDDLLRACFELIQERGERVDPSRGPNTEVTGVLLELTNPLARLSRTESRGKIFSAVAELCWVLRASANVEEMRHYVKTYQPESDVELGSAYGPRLFNWTGVNQIKNITDLLSRKPSTRRAVVQLYDRTDIGENEVPCTCTLQFLIRNGRLSLFTSMRSNDIALGLPHDIFCFTMLQEIVARHLRVDLGDYKHFVGSLHLYEKHSTLMQDFMKEGYQDICLMPSMPSDGLEFGIRRLLYVEQQLRHDPKSIALESLPTGYWGDLSRLLVAFNIGKHFGAEALKRADIHMTFDVFNSYVRSKIDWHSINRSN